MKTTTPIDTKKTSDMKKAATQSGYDHKATFVQVALCFIANSAVLPSGMTLGFSGVALPYMETPNDVLHVNSEEASWIASLAAIATPLGCLLSGPLIDHFGRKNGLLFVNIPAFIGWMTIAFRPSLPTVYIGRLLTGFALGLSSTPATIFVTEGSTTKLRGLLATGTSIAIAGGIAIVYTLGLIFQENWQMVAVVCGVFPVASGLLTWWLLPESPVWLVSKGRYEEASSSLKALRATKSQARVQQELDEISDRARDHRNRPTSVWASVKSMKNPESYKPLILMNVFFLFQQVTGIFVVVFYAVDIVKEAGVASNPFVVAVLIGLVRLVFTMFAAWMSKRFGRRPCALISGVGMTVSLMILATHLYSKTEVVGGQELAGNATEAFNETMNGTVMEFDSMNVTVNLTAVNIDAPAEDASLLPVITLLVYILTSTIGFLTLPWTMMGEVFPSKIRGVGSGLTTFFTYSFSFVTVKVYPAMLEAMDKHGVFYFYGVMSLLGTIFVAVFLPETQGKTLGEIEEYFSGKKKVKPPQDEEDALQSTQMITITSNCPNESEEKKIPI